jgi:hypothetical protein
MLGKTTQEVNLWKQESAKKAQGEELTSGFE